MNTHNHDYLDPRDESPPEDVRIVDAALRSMARDDASSVPAGFDERVFAAVSNARASAHGGERVDVVTTIGRGAFTARARVWAVAAAALLATTLAVVVLLPDRAEANGMSAEEAALLIELDTWLASAGAWSAETALDYEIESLSEDIASLAANTNPDVDAFIELILQGDPL